MSRTTVRTVTVEIHCQEVGPGEWMATLFAPEGREYGARARDSASAAWLLADQFSRRTSERFASERPGTPGEGGSAP